MRPGALEQRQKELGEVRSRRKPVAGANRLRHVPVLEEENGARSVLSWCNTRIDKPPAEIIQPLGSAFMLAKAARLSPEGILITPRTAGTDGFYVSVMRRAG